MNPERPVCTCLLQPVPGTSLAKVRVFDPYCQIDVHKKLGSTEEEPTYPKAAGNG
ncbi:hypothetical protein PQE16_gp65 [Arthrobacter phage Reedo]|uniref:Uncharacterized protein n=1 Tax=Arthrobacter phage Reedo TaxID=2910755 RepID=A0AA49BN72_9CAUD|nr:hypothetical protein PQE16_gp65 [Arthrobacter phage Reedo]UJQ86855.1 hypothetical protein SEA_REEDO_65 [Arthrobacter phage Reedo]